MTASGARSARLTGPLMASVVLHGGLFSLLFVAQQMTSHPAMPPMYKVELIAAPPGTPAIGEVSNAPVPTPEAKPKEAPKPVDKAAALKKSKAPTAPKAPTKATPVPKSKAGAPATRAGGGEVGGPGTDVANIRTEGINFPFTGYLENIVRQVRLNFSPSDKTLRTAEVFFLIRRDGSMAGFRFLQKSGSYSFDLECQGAVEAAAASKAWGPLPAQFMDDVLPVIFRFDPKTLR